MYYNYKLYNTYVQRELLFIFILNLKNSIKVWHEIT